jgi:hypothetical protein
LWFDIGLEGQMIGFHSGAGFVTWVQEQ